MLLFSAVTSRAPVPDAGDRHRSGRSRPYECVAAAVPARGNFIYVVARVYLQRLEDGLLSKLSFGGIWRVSFNLG